MDSEPTCRVCLQVEDLMIHIYEEKDADLSALLQTIGGISLDKNDNFPKYLCKECTSELLIAVKFREKCLRSQKLLEQFGISALEKHETLYNGDLVCEQNNESGSNYVKANEHIDEEDNHDDFIEEDQAEASIFVYPSCHDEQNEVFNINATKDEFFETSSPIIVEIDLENADSLNDTKQNPRSILLNTQITEDQKQQEEEGHLSGKNCESDELIIFAEDEVIPSTVGFDQIIEYSELGADQASIEINNVQMEDIDIISTQQTIEYVCDICGALFIHAPNLKRHMKREHMPQSYYTCNNCEYCFSSETQYTEHIERCENDGSRAKQSSSPTSSLSADKKCDKKKILLDTSTSSENICNYCGHKMQSPFALNMHLRTHTGERPFNCEYCTKAFKTQSALKTHIKRHAGMPDYACSVCDKTFYETSNLTAHMRTHTGEKPHACTLCQKRFTRVFLLQLHMRTHTGEKPYECQVCKRAFAQSGDLKNHLLIHSGERKHKCSVCPKTFIKRHQLLAHMKKHSSINYTDMYTANNETSNEHQPIDLNLVMEENVIQNDHDDDVEWSTNLSATADNTIIDYNIDNTELTLHNFSFTDLIEEDQINS